MILEKKPREDLPTTRSSAQIDQDLGTLEEVVLFVKLDQLERRTGTVTLFLGHVVVLIQTSCKSPRISEGMLVTLKVFGTFSSSFQEAACAVVPFPVFF